MVEMYYIGMDSFCAIVSDCTIDSYLDDLVKDRFMSLDGIAMDSKEIMEFVRGCMTSADFQFIDEDSDEVLYLTRLDSESFERYIFRRYFVNFPLIIDIVGSDYRKYLPLSDSIKRKWEKITGIHDNGSF